MSADKMLKTISDENVEYVDIRFTDPRGKLQHVTVMSDQVDGDFIDEGFMFDGSSIAGWKSIEASDMKLMIDTESAYIDPFYAEKTLCDNDYIKGGISNEDNVCYNKPQNKFQNMGSGGELLFTENYNNYIGIY